MKALFDKSSFQTSKLMTNTYSTSFSLAVKMLSPSIREDIYNIYGFVRLADEIVDSFHDYDKGKLLTQLEKEFYQSLDEEISLNPILNAFQHTVRKYNIDLSLVDAFLHSMKMDLNKIEYDTDKYREYIYGSADVVGLMCLKVFVKGNNEKYEKLKKSAMHLGSAFQKVNFLRDLKNDYENLDRVYFPNVDLKNLNAAAKAEIEKDISNDFLEAYKGILQLPNEAKFGVYTAYIYYKRLFKKLLQAPTEQLLTERIRVPDYEKAGLLAKSFVQFKLNML